MKQPIHQRRIGAGNAPLDRRPSPRAAQANSHRLTPCQLLGHVLLELHRSGQSDEGTQRLAELMTRFVIYVEKGLRIKLASEISTRHVEDFVLVPVLGHSGEWQRPTAEIIDLRRSAVALYFRIGRRCGFVREDPAQVLEAPRPARGPQ